MKAQSIVPDRPDSNMGGGQPAQIDMFTGAEPPKRGRVDGRHIRLRDQAAKPARMAHPHGGTTRRRGPVLIARNTRTLSGALVFTFSEGG